MEPFGRGKKADFLKLGCKGRKTEAFSREYGGFNP